MTKAARFTQMKQVTEALYLAEHQKIRAVLAEESVLRGKLAELAALTRPAIPWNGEDLSAQMVGADILWQGWAARTGRQLNIELAQVLARKAMAMRQVGKAFGRWEAVRAMSDAAQAAARRDAARAVSRNS